MPRELPNAKNLSLDELAEFIQGADTGSDVFEGAVAEIQRRQTIAQIEATKAAAKNARYTLWTAIAAGVSAIVSAKATFMTLLHH